MRILMVCEGDAENPEESFSGSTYSILRTLRSNGVEVATADAELYGPLRWLGALLTFTPNRRRWSVRYRLAPPAAALRTAVARRAIIRAHPRIEAILQIGATFRPQGRGAIPYYLYCDSNIQMAVRGSTTGFSQAAAMTAAEQRVVIGREREIYDGAAGIFTISDRLRRSFIEDFGMAADRVHAVRAGPNFDPAEIPGERASVTAPNILFVGTQFQRKGGDVLLEAFRSVRRSIPGARLTIIGPRDLAIADEGVDSLGHLRQDDPAARRRLLDAYAAAAVYCLPTRYEPFGISYLEAMYFGVPCIGTDTGAVPEMIIDGETGYLVPVDDAEALADRLVTVLRDPVLASRMGDAGRRRAREIFTWPAAVDRMLAVMRR
ncbi:MAG TPA: glycosyltransferase family 4 protein [Gemmatimonadaceae bacterium]|nr:glycosyltransferase family 4 protein [Gemmatimonadaceae bacterium]